MSVTLSQSYVVLAKGASSQLSAAVSPDGGTLGWSSSDGGIASVDNGLVSGVGEGVDDITASASWPYWGPWSASAKVSVYDPIKQTPGLVLGDTALLYWADPSADSEQLDKDVQVSVVGRLGGWWVVDSAGVPGFVAKADIKLLTKVDLSAEYLVFQVGDNTTLTVDAAPDPDGIDWSSSAAGVLSVGAGGQATAKGEGVTVVSATGSWSFTDPVSGTATASVYTPVEKVGAVAKQAMSVRAAADGKSRVDDGVAKGDTMVVLGKAGDYLYVEHGGVRGFVPKQASEVNADIVITDADLVLAVGQTQPLGVKITPAGTDPAVWASTDPSIVSVDQ
ncbi:MAG: Ig-like domain-containing protein, partial [Propionibacteriaceae bacterium]|nr:Ig-like domain-containing protein [Propionibacteriaceae bacterium]